MTTTRKTFTTEFKLDAIKLAKKNGNIEETAQNLGIGAGSLHRWIRQHKQHNAEGRPIFTGKGKPALTEQEARIKQLERDLEIARLLDPKKHLRVGSQERDILKKAVACLDPKTHLAGGIASLPRNPDEIPIHSKPPSRVQPCLDAQNARGFQERILRLARKATKPSR